MHKPIKDTTHKKGRYYENIAADFLIAQNHKIITKNYTTRYGEIDLITEHLGSIIFVEVKYRKNFLCSGPNFSIPIHKQNRIINTAKIYMLHNNLHNVDCRFDALCIYGIGSNINIDWLQNIF